jgi:hypothetical protein
MTGKAYRMYGGIANSTSYNSSEVSQKGIVRQISESCV